MPPTVVCSHCGEENPERARFCLACGSELKPADQTETRKVVTIMFTDVTGSTSLGELLDPESLRGVMGRYFDVAHRVVTRHGGSVEKFIGDAVMAVFGVPHVHEDDALRAVRSALELNAKLEELNDDLERAYGVRLAVRTGVNTGEVAVGGGEVFATGDAVNVAARLEQAAEPGEILVAETTRQLVRDAVDVEPLEPLELKGKSARIEAWRLRGIVGQEAFERRVDVPLVGRERELAQLRALYEEARDQRRCRLCTVLGPAGIGKSRLVHEFVASVETETQVLMGRCLPYGEGITYWPLESVVRGAAGIGEEPPEQALVRIRALLDGEEAADVVADRVAGAIGLVATAAPSEEIFLSFRRLFETLARDRPLLLVFDDVHWAEVTFLDLVEHLAARIQDAPVLLLCTARPEFRETRPGWDGGELEALALPLEPLDESESAMLVERLVGQRRLTPRLQARIMSAAEGNPLFVEEMLSMLEHGDAGDDVAVPPTIQALVAARLDQLEPGERDVLGPAAVVGQEFAREALIELLEGRGVDGPLAALVGKDLLRRDDEAARRFHFRHLLIHDAAYASLPKRVRAALHERFGRFLGTVGEHLQGVEELAGYHLEQAYQHLLELGPPDERAQGLAAEAAELLAAGGTRANARGDLPAAANLLQRALALSGPDAPERAEVQTALGATQVALGQLEDADVNLAEAEEAAARSGARAVELAARIERYTLRLQARAAGLDVPAVAASVQAAIPELERLGADRALASAWRLLCITSMAEHRMSAAEEAAAHALEHARRSGHVRGEAEALFWVTLHLLVGPTPVEEGLRRSEELLTGSPGPLRTAAVETLQGALRGYHGDIDEGRRLVRRGREGFRELGFVLHAEGQAGSEASVEIHAGDLDAAERVLRTASQALEAIGETTMLGAQYGTRSWLLARLDRPEEALELAARSEAIASSVFAQVELRHGRSLALARLGKHAQAAAVAQEAVDLIAGSGAAHGHGTMLENLGEVLLLAGRVDEGERALAEALALIEQKGCTVCGARLRAQRSVAAGPSLGP